MIRYLITIITGLIFGLLWGWLLVDFPTQWFENLHPTLQLLFSILPILALFLFAMLLSWWDYKKSIIFCLIIFVLSLVGNIQNENTYGCACSDNIEFIYIAIFFVGFVSIFIIIGEFGRWSRRFIHRTHNKT